MPTDIKCGRSCIPRNAEDCSSLISDVVNGGSKLKVDIRHETADWFSQFRLLKRMGGGKSGALVYRSVFVPSQSIVGATTDVLKDVVGGVVGAMGGAAYGLTQGNLLEGAQSGMEYGQSLLRSSRTDARTPGIQTIQRTVALKLYFDAFDKDGKVQNTRPFREVDAQCRLSGHVGFNCQLAVRTLSWGDVRKRLFRSGAHTTAPDKSRTDYVTKTDLLESEWGLFEGKKKKKWPKESDKLDPDIYTMELPYIPKRDDQKVLVMVTDWTPGQPLLSLQLSDLDRSQLLGLFLELAAVWQRGYRIFREDDRFAHWDLHPDNIFVNLDEACRPRGDVRLPVETTLKRVRGLMQTFLVASLPASSEQRVTQRLQQALVRTFDAFLESELGTTVYQNARAAYGLAKEYMDDTRPGIADNALVQLGARLLAKLDEVLPEPKKGPSSGMDKKAVQVLRRTAQASIKAMVRYLRRLLRTPDLVLRFPQVTLIDFDLVTSERLFRLEVEHTGKLKSMVPITERAVAFLLRNVPMEVGLAWIRALSSMFRSFSRQRRPYYLVDLNHLLTYLFVCGIYYQVPTALQGGGGQAVHTLLRVGYSMVEAFGSMRGKLEQILEDPPSSFWQLIDRSIQLQNARMLDVARDAARRLASGLEEATWGALAASYGEVALDINTLRSVRNVVFGRQSVRSLVSKQVRQALGLDVSAQELLRMFFHNYIQHMTVLSWSKFKAFPNQDTLGLQVVLDHKVKAKKNTIRDLTIVLLAGDTANRVSTFVAGLPEHLRDAVDAGVQQLAPSFDDRLSDIKDTVGPGLNVAMGLAYDKSAPPTVLLQLDGGSQVKVHVQGALHLKLGYADLTKAYTNQMHIPTNTAYWALRSFLYMRGGVQHESLKQFAVKLDNSNIAQECGEALAMLTVSDLKLSLGGGGMKLEVDLQVNSYVSEALQPKFITAMLHLISSVLGTDGLLGKVSAKGAEWLETLNRFITEKPMLYLINYLLDRQLQSNDEFDAAPRARAEVVATGTPGVYRLLYMNYNAPPHALVKCASAVRSGNLADALDCLSYLFPDQRRGWSERVQTNALMCLLTEELAPWLGTAKVRVVNEVSVDGTAQQLLLAELLQMKVHETKPSTNAVRRTEFELLPSLREDPWMENDVLMWALSKVVLHLNTVTTELAEVSTKKGLKDFVESKRDELEKLCPAFLLKLWDNAADGVEMFWNQLLRVWTMWMEKSREYDVNYLFLDPAHTTRTLQKIVREACALVLVDMAEDAMKQALQFVQASVPRKAFEAPKPKWKKLNDEEAARFHKQLTKLVKQVLQAKEQLEQSALDLIE